MNLSSTISERLWQAVRASYEAGNYSGAILGSVYYLSDVIRDKSGLASDGVQLVGDAFSGPNPIIKINALHTQSDRDEQKGVHFLLMGFYQAIRNPRSHEKRTDSIETANAIVYFADYLLGLIDKARSPFDASLILAKVRDPLFGQSEKYADLLVAKVPARRLLEILMQLLNRRSDLPLRNLDLFVHSAVKVLTEDEQSAYWQLVSESLEEAATDIDFIVLIRIAHKNWEKISEIGRIRTEHRLIESVREGEFDTAKDICSKGRLGNWITKLGDKLTLKKEYSSAVSARIMADAEAAWAYSFKYHFHEFRKINPKSSSVIVNRIIRLLSSHDNATYNALSFVDNPANASECDSEWIAELKDAYDEFAPF